MFLQNPLPLSHPLTLLFNCLLGALEMKGQALDIDQVYSLNRDKNANGEYPEAHQRCMF